MLASDGDEFLCVRNVWAKATPSRWWDSVDWCHSASCGASPSGLCAGGVSKATPAAWSSSIHEIFNELTPGDTST